MDETAFKSLRDASLHTFTPQDWAAWYPDMVVWLDHDDARIREAALERLTMAVFSSEPMSCARGLRSAEAQRQRAEWLLGAVERAHAKHAELLAALLRHLRWHGDDAPFPDVLLPWLRALPARRLANVPDGLVTGTAILLGGGTTDELVRRLDDPADYVRGCAAYILGRSGFFDKETEDDRETEDGGETEDDGPDVMDAGRLDWLTGKELERPGLVGAFWSGCGLFHDHERLGRDPVEWMLGIIERRHGPEPDDMPFNGIDFHIHELAAFNPDAVRRLMAAGRHELALMTATEIRDVVAGMAPVLHDLAGHADAQVALGAQMHLARYYGEIAAGTDPARVKPMPGWRDGVDVFVLRYGDAEHWADMVVFLSRNRPAFDRAEAWSIIDAMLPPDLRGALTNPYPGALGKKEARPMLSADREIWFYASGAMVTLSAADGSGWRRLEIAGGRLREQWRPFGG